MLIDDNFLSKEEIKDIQDRVLIHGLDIPWTLAYQTDIDNGKESIGSVNAHASYQFAAGLYPGMPAYDFFLNVFSRYANRNNIHYKEIIRLKLNWLPKVAHVSENPWHMPHVDSNQKHFVFLYYINAADGDTYFFNEKYPLEPSQELTLNSSISPKAGRGVLFDGYRYHASSSPVKSEYRCILNVDFI